jgi:glycosyltransferase involved in cell wall biosynthesis
MKLLFSIPSMQIGGAERQLTILAVGLAARGHDVAVAAFAPGPLASELRGVRFLDLGKRSRLSNPLVFWRLFHVLRDFRPQVHYSLLGLPNILGALLRPLCTRTRLIMGVRASEVGLGSLGLASRIVYGLERRLAATADAIIVNSEAGRKHALAQGFPARRLTVVRNGIDTLRFAPQRELGAELRAKWGAGPKDLLVGLPARLDPIKDHATFLRASAMLSQRHERMRFVCIGDGPERESLTRLAQELGLGPRLVFAGECRDMPAACNALDLACLCSRGEGFPNALGEAMACGVPCVSTEVGDAAEIVGDTGEIVRELGDPDALAAALENLAARIQAEPAGLAQAARERIRARFSIEAMLDATEVVLQRLAH